VFINFHVRHGFEIRLRFLREGVVAPEIEGPDILGLPQGLVRDSELLHFHPREPHPDERQRHLLVVDPENPLLQLARHRVVLVGLLPGLFFPELDFSEVEVALRGVLFFGQPEPEPVLERFLEPRGRALEEPHLGEPHPGCLEKRGEGEVRPSERALPEIQKLLKQLLRLFVPFFDMRTANSEVVQSHFIELVLNIPTFFIFQNGPEFFEHLSRLYKLIFLVETVSEFKLKLLKGGFLFLKVFLSFKKSNRFDKSSRGD
jgi:hypothetical protein